MPRLERTEVNALVRERGACISSPNKSIQFLIQNLGVGVEHDGNFGRVRHLVLPVQGIHQL